MEEIEAKFLDVDQEALEAKLVALGATKEGEYFYKRKSYDFADKRLAKENAWVRLRDEGNQVVLTHKQRFGVGADILKDGGVHEIEIVVSDFESADALLVAIGLVSKFYEENKRVRYILDDVELDIDLWPMIPAYLEVEGKSWEKVEAVSKKLGFDWEKHVRCSTMQIYETYGINENDYSIITFETQVKRDL